MMSFTPETILLLGLVGALFAIPGCAEDISPEGGPDGAPLTDGMSHDPGGPVATVRNADGSYTTRIDATSTTAWVWVDLQTGAQAPADGPWDLAAQRYHLRLNPASSGEVAPIAAEFGAVTAAPATGWRKDAPDANDDGVDELAFEQDGGWYAYDPATHVLTPRPLVWAVRSENQLFKLVIESYYDDAGTSGHLRLRWAPLGGGMP